MSQGNAQNVAKPEDGTAGDRGTIYEKLVCMLFAVRAYILNLKDFQLRYQVPESDVGKFDDIVFDEGQNVFQVFQLKHKETETNKISNFQLFNESFYAEYNLLKYVKTVIDLFSNNDFKGELKMAVVFTNIDFDIKNGNKLNIKNDKEGWCNCKNEIQLQPLNLNEKAIFDISDHFAKAKYYKFNGASVIQTLQKQKETLIFNLTAELNQPIKITGNSKYDKQQQKIKKGNEVLKKFLEDIEEKEIRKALRYIIYAVNQPNDKGIEQIIKKEIMEHYQLQNVDTVYNAIESAFTKWCSSKDPLNDSSSLNKHIIGFKNIEVFFEKYVKKKQILFGITAPTKSFTGRLDELEYIKKKLEEQHNLIISQVAITGLGGIGKTELTKQFIFKYGQSDFYGRVIWIEADSDESVKNSFTRFAEKIEIDKNQSLLTIIDLVFEYFNGVKVLFVFDNFYQNPEENEVNPGNNVEKNFVIHCQKQASALPKENRPYFIFTSRNRKCLPRVPYLDLSVLTPEDAQQLVMVCLENCTKEDAEKIAERLQYFPLAIKQATAYINEMKSMLGGRYEIKDYFTEFEKKTKDLLNYAYTNDFGEYEKTTFLTWNITLDAILKDKTNGKDAIKVLKIMSYLYADKIDDYMFFHFFDNDMARFVKAFGLLNKYSLITKIENSNLYQIHRLVQAVIQLKFKKIEEEILGQAWKFVNIELYENHHKRNSEDHWRLECTFDEYLHYNNLSTYMKNYSYLNRNFHYFFYKISDKFLVSPVYQDDVELIKGLKLSKDVLEKFAERNFERMVWQESNQTIKYFIEDEYIDLNYCMSLLLTTVNDYNPDLLKYFVEKFDYFSHSTILSTEFISDIKEGKSDSLLKLIESEETETNVRKLKESLFFAVIYEQDSIVELLIDKNVQPDYKIEKWNINYAPIVVASGLGYSHIVKILLKPFDNLEFWKDILQMIFEFLKIFADLNNVEYVGQNYTDLYYATNFDVKIEIADFLLRRYSGYSNFKINQYTLLEVLKIIEDDLVKYSSYKNILIQIQSNVPKCEFISSLVKTRFNNQFHETLEMLKKLNNYKDETKLISCIRDLTLDFLYDSDQIKTVETIVKKGVDVNATDQNVNNALYYSVDLDSCAIFNYLLPKTNLVHENILMKVIKKNKLSCVELLLKTHFPHNHSFLNEKSLLEVANENNSFKVIDLLLKLSKVYENDKMMGLINYIKNCKKFSCQIDDEFVKHLVDNGVKVNTMDSDQHNALYYFIELEVINNSGFNRIFRYLVVEDSLVSEENLERAIELDNIKAVKEIIPKYFNKNHYLEKQGCSIIDFALRCDAKNVHDYLLKLNV